VAYPNAMPLPNLIPAGGQVQVQNTTFAVDALGRYVCSTWDEATANGGAPFAAIVVGAGMYGAYCAAKMFRRPMPRDKQGERSATIRMRMLPGVG
jgi:hypothetical protein